MTLPELCLRPAPMTDDDPHSTCSFGSRNCADCYSTCTDDALCPCCALDGGSDE